LATEAEMRSAPPEARAAKLLATSRSITAAVLVPERQRHREGFRV